MAARLSRRGFVLGAGAAALTGTGFARPAVADAATGAGEPEVLVGILDRVELPATAYVQTTDGTVAVSLSGDAVFIRDDGYALALFRSGDEVVAEGKWEAGEFIASLLMIMFRAVDGRVIERVGHLLATTGGVVVITPHTLFVEETWRPLAEGDVTLGDDVSIPARKDAVSGDLVASAIERLP